MYLGKSSWILALVQSVGLSCASDEIDLGGEDELDIATSHGSLSYGDVVGGCQPYRARLKSGGYSTWAYQNTVTLNT
ncbi:hypothetical protein FOXB_03443 [Fusarium oxysporum f. sp. conglutinans Fo5176]|uniref:Uncharacterized protein n=1 Tax=Fusarium oxysporum (strain Fo5176) TaxID=660025 RepID=F9FAL7_FUSOF|nr:hypothetical protein FOXB_03443 [Fusarium oxysporum f. sp. conglutinans Fo5176]